MEPHTIMVICACITVCLAVFGVGVKWILKEIGDEAGNRDRSAKTIIEAQTSIKTELKNVTDGHEKRLEKLEDKASDFRTGQSIDAGLVHLKNNVVQMIEGVRGNHDRTANVVDYLKDRVTKLETQHEQTTKIVGEIKSELRETRHEINDRFDIMAKTQQQQFTELCNSIREAREAKIKS